jgi:hypothetical protein
MSAIGLAKKQHVTVDTDTKRELIAMMHEGELKEIEADWQRYSIPIRS